jgi:hypothetical protein
VDDHKPSPHQEPSSADVTAQRVVNFANQVRTATARAFLGVGGEQCSFRSAYTLEAFCELAPVRNA